MLHSLLVFLSFFVGIYFTLTATLQAAAHLVMRKSTSLTSVLLIAASSLAIGIVLIN